MSSIVTPIARAASDKFLEQDRRLGHMLVERGVISAAQLDFARQKQQVENRRIGQIMVNYGWRSDTTWPACWPSSAACRSYRCRASRS